MIVYHTYTGNIYYLIYKDSISLGSGIKFQFEMCVFIALIVMNSEFIYNIYNTV